MISSGNRFSGTDKAIYEGGYLYLYGNNLPSYITIKVILSNFLEPVASDCEVDCVDCESCISYLDTEFKIQESLIEPMIGLTNQELVKEFSQMREDLTNNNQDSMTQQSK